MLHSILIIVLNTHQCLAVWWRPAYLDIHFAPKSQPNASNTCMYLDVDVIARVWSCPTSSHPSIRRDASTRWDRADTRTPSPIELLDRSSRTRSTNELMPADSAFSSPNLKHVSFPMCSYQGHLSGLLPIWVWPHNGTRCSLSYRCDPFARRSDRALFVCTSS